MKTGLLLIIVLLSGSLIYAQQGNCRVLLPAISGEYSGGCKNGRAHGKGKARGTDTYEGRFIKGLPSGNATYTWGDGYGPQFTYTVCSERRMPEKILFPEPQTENDHHLADLHFYS